MHVNQVDVVASASDITAVPRGLHGKIGTLELGRGVAAFLVVLDHAGYLVAENRYFGRDAFNGLLLNGHVGVDFFFVLSGFIIATVHWPDIGDRMRLGHYAGRRFFRIMPPYWVILSIVVPIYLGSSLGVARQHQWSNVLASYLLFPMPEQPVLGVAWTLTFEAFFYLLFAGLIRFGRRFFAVFLGWILVIAVVNADGQHDYPLSFLGSPFNLQFLLGMVVAAAHRRGLPRSQTGCQYLLWLGLTIFFAGVIFMRPDGVLEVPLVGRTFFGLAAAAIILGASRLEQIRDIRVPGWLQQFGAMSYSLYLSHVVVESLFMRSIPWLPTGLQTPDAVAVLVSIAALGGGWLYWRLIERPLVRLRRRGRGRG